MSAVESMRQRARVLDEHWLGNLDYSADLVEKAAGDAVVAARDALLEAADLLEIAQQRMADLLETRST